MKVAIVTSFPREPARPIGGVEAVSVHLVHALSKFKDLDVHVVTCDAECRSHEKQQWQGATLHRLPRSGKKTLPDALGPGRRTIQEFLDKLRPDVIHAHDTYGLMVQGMHVPRVFTIHGFIHGDTLLAGERFSGLRARIWKHYETRGWADQPHIVSISPYVRERLAGISTGIIHDIDNPIGEEFFRLPRQERKGTIFCAAVICPRKNQHVLVEALGLLKQRGVDAELRLAGKITEENYGNRLKQRIVDLQLNDRVKLLGSLTSEQVQQELTAASVFALVSLEEGSPMGIEEAMAVGVPVVSSNRCGMPYMIRDGETGFLIDPHNAADVAWRLEQLLADDALRAAMGEKAKVIARDRFHPDVVARRTKAVYERALRDRNGQAHL